MFGVLLIPTAFADKDMVAVLVIEMPLSFPLGSPENWIIAALSCSLTQAGSTETLNYVLPGVFYVP
jgi:hypothetical protein